MGARRPDPGDEREAAELALDVVERRLEAWVLERDRVTALDEHLLAGMFGEARRDDLLGAPALAGPEILVTLVVDPGGAADHHRGDDEGEPPEDRRLAVGGAPPPSASCEVAVVPHDRDRTPATARGNPERLRKAGPHELPICALRAGGPVVT